MKLNLLNVIFLVNALLLIWENANSYFQVLIWPQVKTAYVTILEDNY